MKAYDFLLSRLIEYINPLEQAKTLNTFKNTEHEKLFYNIISDKIQKFLEFFTFEYLKQNVDPKLKQHTFMNLFSKLYNEIINIIHNEQFNIEHNINIDYNQPLPEVNENEILHPLGTKIRRLSYDENNEEEPHLKHGGIVGNLYYPRKYFKNL